MDWTVGIITRNRADALVRCVRSHVEVAHRFGHTVDFVIVNDGDDGDALGGVLHGVALESPGVASIVVVNPARRRALADRLVQLGIPRDVAEVAIVRPEQGGVCAGAARNVALLYALAGERPALLSDDDMLASPEGRTFDGSVCNSRAFDPTRFLFGVEKGEDRAIDLFGEYSRAMGVTGVVAACPGIRGDSGMGVPASVLLSEGAHAELFASEARYREFAYSRRVRRAVDAFTRVQTPFGMAGHLVVDGARLLPPFAPLGRNQDGVFFGALRAILPDTFTALLALTVVHDAQRTTSREELLSSIVKVRVNDFLLAALGVIKLEGSDASARCVAIGRSLAALASSHATVERVYASWWTASRRFHRARVQSALGLDALPPSARMDLLELAARLDRELAAPSPPTPEVDLVTYLGAVGRVFEYWPAIVRAARTALFPRAEISAPPRTAQRPIAT